MGQHLFPVYMTAYDQPRGAGEGDGNHWLELRQPEFSGLCLRPWSA